MKKMLCHLAWVALCLCEWPAMASNALIGQRSALDTVAEAFKSRVLENIHQSLAAVRTLRERIEARDLPGAQRAWLAAREGWESSEIVTSEYFPDLDRAIDAWPDGERGFHAIEARLFGAHSTDALVAAEELVSNLTELERRLRDTELTAQGLLNGLVRLTYEIGEDKSGGGESPFSGNSLAEIGNNVEAIAAAYVKVFSPSVSRKHAGSASQVTADIDHLRSLTTAPSLGALDQTALREVTEDLSADLAALGQQLGLEKPALGN